MVYVTKEMTFDSAHMLVNHDGLCKNVHGHTYKVQVTVAGISQGAEAGPKEGMLIDFTDLKKGMKHVFDQYDHAFIAGGYEPINILSAFNSCYMKLKVIGDKGTAVMTTCEVMAPFMLEELKEYFATHFGTRVKVVSLKLWETPTSFCEVKGDK